MMLFKDLISRNPSLKLKLNNFENKLLLKISGVTSDSKEVKLGFIFVAIKGLQYDGSNFIAEARKNGSALIISLCRRHSLDSIRLSAARLEQRAGAWVVY